MVTNAPIKIALNRSCVHEYLNATITYRLVSNALLSLKFNVLVRAATTKLFDLLETNHAGWLIFVCQDTDTSFANAYCTNVTLLKTAGRGLIVREDSERCRLKHACQCRFNNCRRLFEYKNWNVRACQLVVLP